MALYDADTYRSEFYPHDPEVIMQSATVVDPSHLLAGMGSETALTTGNTNDSPISANMQNFDYPQVMSIGGRSNSSTSQVSPVTRSLDMSFLQPSMSSLDPPTGNLSMNQSFPQSFGNLSEHDTGHQRSTRVSSTGKITRLTPSRGPTHNKNSTLQLQLSSAPQTKSEQQRQRLDLDKVPRAKLQEIVQALVSQQQNGKTPGSKDSHTPNKIADLLQENSKSTKLQQRPSHGSGIGMQQCSYPDCNFSGRTCDLNKHRKRHDRPYGCTYPRCYKKFGAKSDWKRHENSQHFQQEAFRCNHLVQVGKKCGQHFHRATQFQSHLEHEHKVTSKDKVQAAINSCRIGKNCQGQYWCGFCCEIKTLKAKRNYAWDERFDHIALHFERGNLKKCIDDWVCVEENRPKKELKEEMSYYEEEKGTNVDRLSVDKRSDAPEAMSTNSLCSLPSPGYSPDASRKRSASEDAPSPRSAKRKVVKFCVSLLSTMYRYVTNGVVSMR